MSSTVSSALSVSRLVSRLTQSWCFWGLFGVAGVCLFLFGGFWGCFWGFFVVVVIF